jgi:hypothetical protein
MPADLRNARLKLARAKERLDELRESVDVYMDPPPYRVETKRQGHEQRGHIYVEREPDLSWGMDFGEIAVNARSVLDMLVKQLVIDSDNKPVRANAFPIFLDHEEYAGKGRGKSFRERQLQGVAKKHRRLIDEYQPYHRGTQAGRDPLAILAAVANREKHEDIHVALGVISNSVFRLTQSDGTVMEVSLGKDDHTPFREITDGMELLGLINKTDADAPDAKVKLDVAGVETQLVFRGDGLVTLDDMERSVQRVAEIIERFEKRLASSG